MTKIVIGGGPSGMMAALTAAGDGKKVILSERNGRLGKKLSITGKGRCNVTNDCDAEEFFNNVPRNPKFLYSAFYSFTNQHTKDFFESLGVPLKVERGMRVFPKSDKAADIVKAMEQELKKRGVRIVWDRAKELDIKDGRVIGVKCEKGYYAADSVLIASGGMSYPRTGSTGDGYKMAQSAGHTIAEPTPSLIGLNAKGVSSMMGLSLKNVSVTLLDEKGKKLYTDFGEMMFTHFGVSGPVILSASGHMSKGGGHKIVIDLKPALTEAELDKRLLRDFEKYKNRDFVNSLEELLPKKMIEPVIERSGIDGRKKVNNITKDERHELIKAIKAFSVETTGFRPIDEAIVTRGGVKVSEINPSTMESRKVQGLYFSGEVIDCDGYTGGFNLQIAFSTGYLAGKNM